MVRCVGIIDANKPLPSKVNRVSIYLAMICLILISEEIAAQRNKKYKDYIYRKMLVQEYLKK